VNVDVIIPALDEEGSVGDVVRAIPRPPVRTIIVADNGSRDGTAEEARAAGALVVSEPRRGYGSACLRAIAALADDCDLVVFLDADGADVPALLPDVIAPIVDGDADLVIGSRALGEPERGSMTAPQRVGNRIASTWLRRRFGLHATDLGPFRAIRRDALDALGMRDPDYGWTVEMQIKAARHGLRYAEVPVPYRRSRGPSKVSGTVRGVVGATSKILGLLAYYDLARARR
jgi:glycosyltransferase involved in cell wall biosynthesis